MNVTANTTNEQLPIMKGNFNLDGSLQTTAYNYTSPLMNTWTNNKFISNNKEIAKEAKTKKFNYRPRSGDSSPTKMNQDGERMKPNLLIGNYSRQAPTYTQKPSYMGSMNDDNMGLIQLSNNQPQPHQRNIKKGVIGNKQNNIPNDMYRIYGVNKSDLGPYTAGNTPKTSSGKRNPSGNNHFGIRINSQMVPTRVSQRTSHGNRSVSPNRLPDQNTANEKELYTGQNRPNMVDILKFQARTNLKNLEKDMSSLLGRNKKILKKKKIGKGAMNYYGFSKPTPTHKRVKSSAISKDPIAAVHKRLNKTPLNPSPMNRNNNSQVNGIKGFSYMPLNQNSFGRQKDSRTESNKPFNRNESRKKYRDGSSESNITDSYFKSFDSKRIKKKKKVKKVLPGSGIQTNF
jgi:hypothetical protein